MYSGFIKYIKIKYKISDYNLHLLFGVDKETHYKTLQKYPEWHKIVDEFENIL